MLGFASARPAEAMDDEEEMGEADLSGHKGIVGHLVRPPPASPPIWPRPESMTLQLPHAASGRIRGPPGSSIDECCSAGDAKAETLPL